MRILSALLIVGIAGLFLTWSDAQGQDKKEVTLKGKICCPKCELEIAKKCSTCIVVKEKDKDVVYHFDDAANKEHHKTICSAPKNGSVTGVVGGTPKKKTITVSKVTFE